MAQDLCARNKGLYGTLRVVSTHHYPDTDVNLTKQSMKNWRLVRLTGDDLFHDSLVFHHVRHDFVLGGDVVRIHGGRSPRPHLKRRGSPEEAAAAKRARWWSGPMA